MKCNVCLRLWDLVIVAAARGARRVAPPPRADEWAQPTDEWGQPAQADPAPAPVRPVTPSRDKPTGNTGIDGTVLKIDGCFRGS